MRHRRGQKEATAILTMSVIGANLTSRYRFNPGLPRLGAGRTVVVIVWSA
jgi:hypothetical protein